MKRCKGRQPEAKNVKIVKVGILALTGTELSVKR